MSWPDSDKKTQDMSIFRTSKLSDIVALLIVISEIVLFSKIKFRVGLGYGYVKILRCDPANVVFFSDKFYFSFRDMKNVYVNSQTYQKTTKIS